MKKFVFNLFLLVFVVLICELLLRITLVFLGYSFFDTGSWLEKKYYPEVREIKKNISSVNPSVKKVLILGGSVISSGWSRMESRLDTLLPLKYGNQYRYQIYNAAVAGQSSKDNFIKYQLLESIDFDLVLFYEAINENRVNNIPYELFEKDYSHIQWYDEIELIRKHKELSWTVIPYTLERNYRAISRLLNKKPYLEFGSVNSSYVMYGDSIQSAKTYEQNLRAIVDLAKNKNERLVLINFASYFPENVELTGEQKDMDYFAGCQYACPVSIWGLAENVKKGVETHNNILKKVTEDNQVDYLNLDLPQSAEYFCDVCHISELGAVEFATQIVDFISVNQLFDKMEINTDKTLTADHRDR